MNTNNRANAMDASGRPASADEPEEPLTSPLEKMASGGSELRDHDFGVSQERAHKQPGPPAIRTRSPSPEQPDSGGKPGTIAGDKQPLGAVGTIVNQDGIDPDVFTDR